MAEALLGGLIERGWTTASDIHVVEPENERRRFLASTHPGLCVGEEPMIAVDAVIAVKPDVVASVLPGLAAARVRRVLSIAAGISTSAMEARLPLGVSVVRAMPNTPALVGLAASAIAPGSAADDDDMAWATSILGAVGTVVRVVEGDLDAVTGVSGSGPAYVFRLAEAFVAAAVAAGLDPRIADSLTRQTLLGAATLLSHSGEDPSDLRKAVTSPGGTTQSGLEVLNDADFMGLIVKVVRAATDRSIELRGPQVTRTDSLVDPGEINAPGEIKPAEKPDGDHFVPDRS